MIHIYALAQLPTILLELMQYDIIFKYRDTRVVMVLSGLEGKGERGGEVLGKGIANDWVTIR